MLFNPGLTILRIRPIIAAPGGGLSVENTASPAAISAGASSITITGLTVTSANLIMVATGIGENTSANVPVLSVVRNAVPFLKLASAYDASWTGVEMWYLQSPAAGSNDIVVTFTDVCDQICAGATGFIGAHASPFGTPVTDGNAGGGNPATITFAGAAGNIGFACVMTDENTSITENGTLLWEKQAIGSDTCGGAQTLPGAASMTATWTLTGSQPFSAIGVAIKQA